MNYFQIFLKLIPFIIEAIKAAEIWFSDKPKSGAEKKASVLDSIKAILDGIMATVTGGAADTWEKIRPLVDRTVDLVAGIVFK